MARGRIARTAAQKDNEAVRAGGHAGSRSKQRKRAKLSDIHTLPASVQHDDEGVRVEPAATWYAFGLLCYAHG